MEREEGGTGGGYMYEDVRLTDGVKEEEGMTEWEEEQNEISVVHGYH